MYYLNGKPLKLDTPFSHEGLQYPANWLRQSSFEERKALGISWKENKVEAYDARFYWGSGLPKDLKKLKWQWVEKQKKAASLLLGPTDWMVVRAIEETSKPVPAKVSAFRSKVRSVCKSRETKINACKTVEALQELVLASDPELTQKSKILPAWPVLK